MNHPPSWMATHSFETFPFSSLPTFLSHMIHPTFLHCSRFHPHNNFPVASSVITHHSSQVIFSSSNLLDHFPIYFYLDLLILPPTLSLSVVCLDPPAASREVGQVDQEDVPLSTTPETIAPDSHVHTDKPLATPAVRRIATESKVSIHVFCSHWFVNMSEASALVYVFFLWDFTVSYVTCLYLCTNIFDWHSLFRMLFLFCVKLTTIIAKDIS